MAETFQDRLVTELRLADARTMDQATAVLRDFLPRCNARFAVQPEHPEAAYRPVASDRCLSETLCFKHTRKVGRDNTVKHHWRVLQLLPDRERPSYAGLRVEVLEENWPNIRQALMETVELVDTFGFDSRTIQATNSLLPIAYYLYKKGAPRDFETSDHFLQDRAVIRGWLTRSILKESGIWGSGLDTLLTALREVIRNSNDVEFPAADLRRIMAQRGKTLDFVEEEIEELADMRLGDRRIFPMLTMLFPYLDSRDGSDIDHVFPKSRFAPTRLKAAQVDEELFDEFRGSLRPVSKQPRLTKSFSTSSATVRNASPTSNCWTGQSTTKNGPHCRRTGWVSIVSVPKLIRSIATGISSATFRSRSPVLWISIHSAGHGCWRGLRVW